MKGAPSSHLSEAWLDSLQESGYRLTGALRSIVEILCGSSRALTPLELYDLGRKAHAGLGLVTVYRALEKLEELDLVQRVHQPDGCHMYLRATHQHEHLLLCTGCGRAEYFSGDDLDGLMRNIARQSGFDIREHWLQLFGLCAACQAEPNVAP
jgi:Fe2+ or Zn2+ uptake regulation protein